MIPYALQGFNAALLLFALALPLSMAGTNFAMAVLAASSLALIAGHKIPRQIPGSFWMLLIFFLWAAVTQWISDRAFSPEALSSFSKIWNVLPYVLIPWAGSRLARSSDLKGKALLWLMLAGVFVVFLGALQFWFEVPYFFEGNLLKHTLVDNKRFYGFQSHPLHTGALYSILFLVSLSVAVFYKRDWKCFSIASAVSGLLVLGVLMTGSRSYYLGIAAGAFFLLIARGWKFFLAGGAVLFLAVFILFKTNPYIENRIRTTGISRMDQSSFERIYIWKSAWLMLRDHPVAGVGYRRWRSFLPEYAKASPDWAMPEAALSHAHNSYLTIGAETGLVGLGIFLCFWTAFIFEQVKVFAAFEPGSLGRALAIGVLAAIPCLFVAAFMEHNLLTATLTLAFYFVAGLSRWTGADLPREEPLPS